MNAEVVSVAVVSTTLSDGSVAFDVVVSDGEGRVVIPTRDRGRAEVLAGELRRSIGRWGM